MGFTENEKRLWRRTKAVVKKTGNRRRRQELKDELARDPESADQFDRHRVSIGRESRHMNGYFRDTKRGRGFQERNQRDPS